MNRTDALKVLGLTEGATREDVRVRTAEVLAKDSLDAELVVMASSVLLGSAKSEPPQSSAGTVDKHHPALSDNQPTPSHITIWSLLGNELQRLRNGIYGLLRRLDIFFHPSQQVLDREIASSQSRSKLMAVLLWAQAIGVLSTSIMAVLCLERIHSLSATIPVPDRPWPYPEDKLVLIYLKLSSSVLPVMLGLSLLYIYFMQGIAAFRIERSNSSCRVGRDSMKQHFVAHGTLLLVALAITVFTYKWIGKKSDALSGLYYLGRERAMWEQRCLDRLGEVFASFIPIVVFESLLTAICAAALLFLRLGARWPSYRSSTERQLSESFSILESEAAADSSAGIPITATVPKSHNAPKWYARIRIAATSAGWAAMILLGARLYYYNIRPLVNAPSAKERSEIELVLKSRLLEDAAWALSANSKTVTRTEAMLNKSRSYLSSAEHSVSWKWNVDQDSGLVQSVTGTLHFGPDQYLYFEAIYIADKADPKNPRGMTKGDTVDNWR